MAEQYTSPHWPGAVPIDTTAFPEPDEYKAEDYPDDPNGKPPKDDQPSFFGMTKGGHYVSLGELDKAQAEEDAELAAQIEASGNRMAEDVKAAAHPPKPV